MPEDQPVSPDDREIESALQGLTLAPLHATPRQVWYEAGVEVGRRSATPWRAATATLAATTLSFLFWSPLASHRLAERVVQVPTPQRSVIEPPPLHHSPALSTNLRLRDTLIESGWDALPSSGPTQAPPRPPLSAAPPQF